MSKTVGNFTFHETSIEGVFVIDVKKYGDNRGYFMETYKEADFKAAGLDYKFVQDNQSKSKAGVLRGLHFQKTFPQAKLVRCLEGEVFDVAVDLRKDSPSHLPYVGEPKLCHQHHSDGGIIKKTFLFIKRKSDR